MNVCARSRVCALRGCLVCGGSLSLPHVPLPRLVSPCLVSHRPGCASRYTESGGTSTWCQVCNEAAVANIARDPRWGRLSETYGEDPFLVGTVAAAALTGLQRPNATNPFTATAAVLGRMLAFSGPLSEKSFNAVVDARTLADSYAPSFVAAVVRVCGV